MTFAIKCTFVSLFIVKSNHVFFHSTSFYDNYENINKIDTNVKLRKDIFTVTILSILFIFSIIIIKKMSNEKIHEPVLPNEETIRKVHLISEESLMSVLSKISL